MSRHVELVATIAAGAIGAVLAAVAIGASVLLALPAILGVTAIALVAGRDRAS